MGRFAPSPTGPLHLGSMVAALASYIDARAAGGRWLVRIEDVDTPRTVPGAADTILRQLESFGLEWDGEVIYQSLRSGRYESALRKLQDHVYGCACSRKDANECECSNGLPQGKSARAIKVRGSGDIEDFIVRRADGCWAYQLAVVVDDAEQGITDVVRGADLLESTPRQIYLQRLLGYPKPRYLHVPVVMNERGEKLSKQTFGPAVREGDPDVIRAALRFLSHEPPHDTDPLQWAITNWNRAQAIRGEEQSMGQHSPRGAQEDTPQTVR